MTARRTILLSLAALVVAAAPAARGQSAAGAGANPQAAQPAQPGTAQATATAPTQVEVAPAYHRPTEHEKLRNFAFDTFGPYPIITAIGSAGIQQAQNRPPDWHQGWEPFGDRLGSAYGIQVVTTSTRYLLAEAFREDTLYYRCACSGFFPRLGHALLSTVTARRGDDGHSFFSLAALGAPYAGTMTAALGWYPSRYKPMDGFRMGNFNLMSAAGQNVALEFIYGGPHSMLGRFRILRKRTGDDRSSNPQQ